MTIDTKALLKLLDSGGTCHLVSSEELRALLDVYEAYAKVRQPCPHKPPTPEDAT